MNRKNFLSLTKEQLSEYICPVLLAVTVGFACIYTFSKPVAYVLAVVFAFEAVLLFRLFDRLRKRKNGAFIYALIFAVIMFITLALVVFHIAAFGYFSPMRWFYGQDDVDSFQPDLILALFLGGGFFLISVIYYFTFIRYRTMGFMLCTMFPFFIFAKRSDIMPDFLTTLIMLVFLAVIIHNKRISKADGKENGARLQVDRAYIICVAVFIIITGALTMAAKKPYYQAFLEKNSRLFDPFRISGQGSGNYEELSDQSSPRNGQPNYNYEPLFYFETDSQNEVFLRTRAFSVFNGEVWVNNDAAAYVYYSQQIPEYTTDDIVSDMSALTGESADGLYAVRTGYLSDEDFAPNYLPSPFGIVTDDRPANALRYFKLSSDTSVWRRSSYYFTDPLDDRFVFVEGSGNLYSKAAEYNYSSEEYLDFLGSFGETDEAVRLREDYLKAVKNYTNSANISERLSSLAREVTADCHSDLEKAEALERYFKENGYIYSLEYAPEDNSIDYFVFESKTGYCTNYATAMTLMARAVGLPSRYVEGFAAFEKNEENQLVIRDGYAHAFVEIYIPGAGYLTFDPTVSEYRNLPETLQAGNLGFLAGILNIFNRASVVIIFALLVIVFALLDRFRELFLRILLLFKPINERIILLYANIIKLVGKSAGEDFSAYTPDMLRNYLLENRGVVPEKIISLFEKTAFGNYDCKKEEYKLAFKEYRHCYRFLRRQLRDREKNKLINN